MQFFRKLFALVLFVGGVCALAFLALPAGLRDAARS